MLSKEIRGVMEKYKEDARLFEEYDKTREFALDKIPRNFTIKKRAYWKLKEMSKKRNQPMSRIIEQLIEAC